MSNLPPDWRPEPREHNETCPAMCEWAELDYDDPDEECPSHMSHECTCEALDENWYEAQAEAYADRDQLWDFGDWQR